MGKFAFIDTEMQALRESGLFNTVRVMGSPADAWMVVDGRATQPVPTATWPGEPPAP